MVTYIIDSEKERFNGAETARILGYAGYANFYNALEAEAHETLVEEEKDGPHSNSKRVFLKKNIEAELNRVTKPLGLLNQELNDEDAEPLQAFHADNSVRMVSTDGSEWLTSGEIFPVLGHSSRNAFHMAVLRGRHDGLVGRRMGKRPYLFHKDDVATYVANPENQIDTNKGYRGVSGLVAA